MQGLLEWQYPKGAMRSAVFLPAVFSPAIFGGGDMAHRWHAGKNPNCQTLCMRVTKKEKFTLFSDHNGSLPRRRPGAVHVSVQLAASGAPGLPGSSFSF